MSKKKATERHTTFMGYVGVPQSSKVKPAYVGKPGGRSKGKTKANRVGPRGRK